MAHGLGVWCEKCGEQLPMAAVAGRGIMFRDCVRVCSCGHVNKAPTIDVDGPKVTIKRRPGQASAWVRQVSIVVDDIARTVEREPERVPAEKLADLQAQIDELRAELAKVQTAGATPATGTLRAKLKSLYGIAQGIDLLTRLAERLGGLV